MQLQKCQQFSLPSWQTRDVNQIYQIIESAGKGTYGIVYKASKLQNNGKTNYFALKQLNTAKETEGFPLTALREVKLLQQLDHKNIIKLHEVVISQQSVNTKSSINLVFDYIEHDIFGLLQKKVAFNDAQIKCIMHQLLQGLEYIHSKNIIHRDIKSANLLYSNNGILKIGDFGLSNVIRNRPLTNRVVTLSYRAPEILLGSVSYTTKIDLWSAGCVMAEFFMNRILFLSDSELNQLKLILEKCGYNHNNWPEAQNYPLFSDLELKSDNNKSYSSVKDYIKNLRHNIDENALDLIVNLLQLNPNKRLSASEALQHKYFTAQPNICPLADMPKIGIDCHAQKKQNKCSQSQQQQQNTKVQMKAFGNQQPQQLKFNPLHPHQKQQNFNFFSFLKNQEKKGMLQQQQQFHFNSYQQPINFNNAQHISYQNYQNKQIHQPQSAHKVLFQNPSTNEQLIQEQQTEIKNNFIQQEISTELKVEYQQYSKQSKNIAKQHNSLSLNNNNNNSDLQPMKKIKQTEICGKFRE